MQTSQQTVLKSHILLTSEIVCILKTINYKKMALGVCAYPKIKRIDFEIIQDFRKKNDELYYLVAEPHFSFVFPIENLSRDLFINEITDKSKGITQIDFEIKCATVNKDAVLDYYHLLLVPDMGYSRIVKLHDKLYSDILFDYLRLDIDYIPHVGIANSKDKYKVKSWVDKWNEKEYSITGIINTLTIVDFTNHKLTDLKAIKLK